jgi:phosphoribosyl-AMP cyclohydrolase / phosphoribosyl-ATP pyrophosphohydrolase
MADIAFIERLEALVHDRLRDSPKGSYTARLASGGIVAAAQKIGEEGVELALAAVAEPDAQVVAESADLFFHLLIVLGMRGIAFASVIDALEERHRERTSKR